MAYFLSSVDTKTIFKNITKYQNILWKKTYLNIKHSVYSSQDYALHLKTKQFFLNIELYTEIKYSSQKYNIQ